ncbi:alginate O-acetyltransferase AlgX-related protein [Brachyspira hyodysenteriae]|uniref:alginate O-acetyltransferase AlgX-related protein n=1 Tax=Brachyspira hyodysenteriae TaxID=159 RepID=UPI0022CE1744|nr:hypothetical protein [Brachyspira hyodysenteriae]MCZ9886025.1 hypothetical protein [Brachyspira hyodysenteriae]
MKLKKVLISIYICILVLGFISLIVFSILGGKERIGYLGDLTFIESNENYYSYSFRINYYDKVFRNSDIYGVYIIEDSLPDYIKNIKYKSKGNPFGTLVSIKSLEDEKIDNIKYILKIKVSIFLLFILLIFLFVIFVYILNDLCILIINFFNKIDFLFILKKYIIPIILFMSVFFILLHIYVNNIFIVFILLVLLLAIKKIKKLSNIKCHYIIAIFFSFLILPSIIYSVFGNYFDKTNYEKRTKAEKPIFSINNLSKYTQEYEKYFNDHIAFRNELIQKKVYLDLVLFNYFINTKHTLIGKEDWLFMKWHPIVEQYIGEYMFTDKELEIVKKNLIDFRNKLKCQNIDLVIMIIPEKSTVYDNYLPDYIQKMKCKTNITEQLLNYIKENTDINIVYPKDELIKYKDKYELYYKYDDHWNNLGGYIGYYELMKSINIDIQKIDMFNIYKTGYSDINNVMGIWNDLVWLINLPSTKKYNNQYNYFISNFTTNNYKIIEGKRGPHENLTCISDSINDIHITIFRDSYTCAMFDYLASSFYKTTFIYNLSEDINISNDTNLVLFTFVERFIKDMLLYRIKNINKNLETNSVVSNN